MEIELLKRIIVTNRQQIKDVAVVHRDYVLDENMNYIFTGVRQSGKTYLMYQRIQELMSQGVDMEQIVFLNFDDERLIGFRTEDFDKILQAHYQMEERKPMLFLDEVQNVPGWEHFARRMANEKYNVYITGSNAKMLSSEFATILGGRYQVLNVYPFSFREYLTALNMSSHDNWQYDMAFVNAVQRNLDLYFHFGGFPESVLATQKRNWLSSLFQKMLLGDIVARYGVKNVNALTFLVKKLAESVKQPISYTRLTQMVSSLGEKVQVHTLIDYVRYLEESWLLVSLRNYASRFVEREGNKKYYFCDNGILNLFLMDGKASLFENLSALFLKRKFGDGLFYYKNNIEVDFYLPEQDTLVQASYSLRDVETLQRETESLLKAADYLDAKNLLIVTMEEENLIEKSGRDIKVLPLWKWLLEDCIW